MDVQQFLAREKQKFIHLEKEEREKYFSSSSEVAENSSGVLKYGTLDISKRERGKEN